MLKLSALGAFIALACATQPGERIPSPQYAPGLELVYRGTFTEESTRLAVQTGRVYDLEARLFVVSAKPYTELAVQTLTRLRGPEGGVPAPAVVRLEKCRLDAQGRTYLLTGALDNAPTVPPLPNSEGPTTVEVCLFAEMLPEAPKLEQTWEVNRDGHTVHRWQVQDFEQLRSGRVLKLTLEQTSSDWQKGVAESRPWRRVEQVYVSTATGYVVKLERTLEREDPVNREVVARSQTVYELEGAMAFPGRLGDDRLRDIQQARQFSREYTHVLTLGGALAMQQAESLATRIQRYLRESSQTPYRETIASLHRRADAAQKGDTPPAPVVVAKSSRSIDVGQTAPDVTTHDLARQQAVRLGRLKGRPALLVFVDPHAQSVEQLLRFAQSTQTQFADQASVVMLCVGEQAKTLPALADTMKLTLPLLNGEPVAQEYNLASTPAFLVVDRDMVVRQKLTGWATGTARMIHDELRKQVQRPR